MNEILNLENVSLTYETNNTAIKVLQDINFCVDVKETVSIVGESGSGKTSLIMLIGGLEKVTNGKIFFLENEITNLSEEKVTSIRRKYIGVVFQSFY